MTWLYIALGVVAVLVAAVVAAAVAALRSMRAEFEEISPGPRIRSEVMSRVGRQVIAAERRRQQAGVLRRYAAIGIPVVGPDGVVLSVEQLRFAADLVERGQT
jgi:hypothetical protein